MKLKMIPFLILALLFTFTGCNGSKPAQPLIIGILPDVDSIPLIIARQNGFFQKQGVGIELQQFKSAPERDSALQSGKIDGAISDILAAAFAKEGGFDVRITSLTNGSYKLLVGKNSGIHSFSDLKGKSIAISKNTIIEYATDRMLTENKLKPEEISKQIVPQIPVRLEMLQNGKVDAATLPEPLASTAAGSGAKILNSTDKLGINPGVLLFTQKSIQSKSHEIQAFYKAYNQAAEYLGKEKPASYIDLLVKEAGFPEAVKNSIELPAYTKAGLPSEKDFAGVLDWLKEKGLIKSSIAYKDLIENQFVREAK